MGANPFRYVRSGEPLVIPATTYNAMVDAAQIVRNRRLNLSPHGAGFDSLFVHVVNTTGKTLQRFDVIGLEGPLETQNLDVFLERIIFKGVAPKKEHKGKFAVLQEDAAPDMCVRACVYGTTIAKVTERINARSMATRFCTLNGLANNSSNGIFDVRIITGVFVVKWPTGTATPFPKRSSKYRRNAVADGTGRTILTTIQADLRAWNVRKNISVRLSFFYPKSTTVIPIGFGSSGICTKPRMNRNSGRRFTRRSGRLGRIINEKEKIPIGRRWVD